jgi:hypothetical protein
MKAPQRLVICPVCEAEFSPHKRQITCGYQCSTVLRRRYGLTNSDKWKRKPRGKKAETAGAP